MTNPVVNLANGPIASDTTPTYTALITDASGNPIPGSSLAALTLSIVNTLTGLIINSVDQINILNTGRGTVDENGNLTIVLEVDDTSTDENPGAPSVQRSLVIDFTYNAGASVGRHQVNFTIVTLLGP